MENQEKDIYFSNEALARFLAAQGRAVEKVVCHLWQNIIDNKSTIEIIDNVEFYFAGDHKLTIACNDAGDGLDAIEFDYQQAASDIKTEFGGKIRLLAVDASGTTMWSDVIGNTLNTVRVTKQGDYYKADSVMLDFGTEKREISIAPHDGLIIDYFEEN
jgi:hypothetical protein